MDIHPIALPNFIGRHVRIVPQLDAPEKRTGEMAALRWGNRLRESGIVADIFDLEGLFGDRCGKDLNDAVRSQGESMSARNGTFAEHELFSIFDGGIR